MEYHISEVVLCVDRTGGFAGTGAGDPRCPAARSVLGAGHVTRKNLLPVRVLTTRVELLQGRKLRRRHAIARILALAKQHRRVEVTL